MEEYAEPVQGQFVDVDQPGQPLGVCRNMLALTHGQRAGISGATDRCAANYCKYPLTHKLWRTYKHKFEPVY